MRGKKSSGSGNQQKEVKMPPKTAPLKETVTKSSPGVSTERDFAKKAVPKIYQTPDFRWSLKYGHAKEIPQDLLDDVMLNDGFPESSGDYLFWYGPNAKLLGWTPNDAKHRRILSKLSKTIHDSANGTLVGGVDRDGTSWAVWLGTTENNKRVKYCLLHVEIRPVLASSLVDGDEYVSKLRNTLASHIAHARGEIDYKTLREMANQYLGNPDNCYSMAKYLEEVDPKKKLKVGGIRKEFEQREREIERQERESRRQLQIWFLESCLKQLK